MAEIGLSEVVRALRAELESAIIEGESQRLRFNANAIEMEFQVGVKKEAEGSGGIRFWVVELGGRASYASESIHTVKLSLEPVLAGGGRVRITEGTNESPLNSTVAQPR